LLEGPEPARFLFWFLPAGPPVSLDSVQYHLPGLGLSLSILVIHGKKRIRASLFHPR
jgi:hypothetical protein